MAMAGRGQFTHVSAVLTHDGIIVHYAVDDMGNIWKLLDQPGQKWNVLKNQRQA
jgi:hypothetical protein